MRYICALFIVFIFSGCGYKPVSVLSKNIVGDRVFVDVNIDKKEPKSSVFVKDAVREGIVSRLGRSLSDKNSANTKIIVFVKSLIFSPIVYDDYGYITSYHVDLKLNFQTKFKNGDMADVITSGEHDFSVARKIKSTRYADSITSDAEKFNALKEASKEAFDEYISKIAIKGYDNGSN